MALELPAQQARQAGDLGEAARLLRRLVQVDPLRESAQRELMQALTAEGDYAAAVQVYRDLRLLLYRELHAEPDPETTALFQTLRRQATERAQTPVQLSPSLPPVAPSLLPRLPVYLTRFFGQEEAIARLHALLAPSVSFASSPRLLTLTGPGGSGKTRLAIEAAERLQTAWEGAIWFVGLASLAEARLIPDAIVDALGLPRSPHLEPMEQVVTFLNGLNSPALLLLDNYEHLVEEGAQIVQTLPARVPTVKILVTSRRLLGLSGEQEFPVSPLPTPEWGEGAVEYGSTRPARQPADTPALLAQYASVALFIDRVQAVMPHFQVTDRNAPAVAALCDRLEGIPLAIELAAARAQVLTPAQMLDQLRNRFDFLASRKRDVLERHRTLRTAVEWSYRLLSSEAQRFFRRLSVFRGGWTLKAAEAVCEEPLALEYLAELRECSLLLSEETEQGMRFRMLETLREYGSEQLSQEERVAVRRIHADYYLEVAEKWASSRQTQIEIEHGNMLAALHWFQADENGADRALRLALALCEFWISSHWKEGRSWLEAILATEGAQGRNAARANALGEVGILACLQGDYARARLYYDECLAIRQEINDRYGVAHMLIALSHIALYQGDAAQSRSLQEQAITIKQEMGADQSEVVDSLITLGILDILMGEYARAQTNLEECLAICQGNANRNGLAIALNSLGEIAYCRGDYARAQLNFKESWVICTEVGNQYFASGALYRLGMTAYAQGDYAEARARLEESLAIQQELGDQRGVANSLHYLGIVAFREGQFALARTLHSQSLAIRQTIDDMWAVAFVLETSGYLAAAQGKWERAPRLWGAAAMHREATGCPLPPNEREEYEYQVAGTRKALGEETFTAAWEAGREMSWEQAVAYALNED